jgi:GxxExxY protein
MLCGKRFNRKGTQSTPQRHAEKTLRNSALNLAKLCGRILNRKVAQSTPQRHANKTLRNSALNFAILCGKRLTAKLRKVHRKGTQRIFIFNIFIQINMTENELSYKIIGCAMKVHSELGPGLLENAYEECLNYELKQIGLQVEKQKSLPLVYYDVKLEAGYRIDLLVEDKVVIEIKAVDGFNDVHLAQVMTYLKLSKCKLGLLINFNVKSIKDGIKRVANNL